MCVTKLFVTKLCVAKFCVTKLRATKLCDKKKEGCAEQAEAEERRTGHRTKKKEPHTKM